MSTDDNQSLGDGATFAGQAKRRPAGEMSLGDERTLGDAAASGLDTVIDDTEVVDLEARYKPEGTLGQGGMGAVVLATDTRLERKVAIKRILGEAAGNRIAVQRFLTEAKSIAAINHANVVQIYDYGQAKDGPFLIMEYVDGGSLLDRCRGSALPLEEAIDLACQLCDGLAKAHDLGIIHRDIKPANVLLTKDGTPKLTDFGLAKAGSSDHGQTMTGAVLGTPDFMPPEQRRDAAEVDHRSDLWSLAATVYQMATGRSPKIIRFDLLPAELTKVLGKALEDAKDARYQSARELRDALKTSLRTAATVEEFVLGQCPACGVKNDASRRFCRGCGESLEAPCLSCSKPMPMAEEICGQCGTKQAPLVDERRQAMAAKQALAEGLLGDFAFDRALEIATELRDESHPRLKHLVSWAASFVDAIEKSRAEQTRHAAKAMKEAGKHEAAYDYLSARAAIESIPASLQWMVLNEAKEFASTALERVKEKQAESRRLEMLVKDRLAAKQLDELLPEVEQLLILHPDRADVQRLRGQLIERRKRQAATRDGAIATAEASLAAHDYDKAMAALATIPAAAMTPVAVRLRERVESLARNVRELSKRIKGAVAGKTLDGLLPAVDEYLALKPDDIDAQSLRQSLQKREDKLRAELAERLGQARTLMSECKFEEAQALLSAVPAARRSPKVTGLFDQVRQLASLRATAMKVLSEADSTGYSSALGASVHYQRALAESEIVDHQCDLLLAKVEAAQEQERRTKRMFFITATTAMGIVIAMALTGAGWWARAAYRASEVAAAIAQSRWDDALAIEPDNPTALVGAARAKLQATPADIDGAFAMLDRAEVQPGGAETGRLVRAEALALRAQQHAGAGRLDQATVDLQAAKAGSAPADAVSSAATAIAQGWLSYGMNVASKGDATAVSRAVDSALAAGAHDSAVAPLRARAFALEAVALQGQGDAKGAVESLLRAWTLDAPHATELLEQPKQAPLRENLVAQFRGRFDAAVAEQDWGTAMRVVAGLESIVKVSISWVSETVRSLPPTVQVTLPSASLTSLSPAEVIALPSIRNSIGIELRLVPKGQYMRSLERIGGPPAEQECIISEPFFVGVHEVTNAQWKRVMGKVPSSRPEDEHPVEQVRWEDALAFCRTLSALPEEQTAGRKYRLPKEIEWEYACRAGSTSMFSFGDDEQQFDAYGWYRRNSLEQRWAYQDNGASHTHPVGLKAANAWGLHDMHGNVREFCIDLYGLNHDDRVTRGGSWIDSPSDCRTSARAAASQFKTDGFRVVMSVVR